MIKKLKIRFILVSLLSVLFVLSMTVGAINIYNYSVVEQGGEASLTQIISRGFDGNNPAQQFAMNPGEPGGGGQRDDRLMSEHYFLVSFNSDGAINQSDFRHIFSISETEGKELATSVYNGNVTYGKYQEYRYKKEVKDALTYVAFIDLKTKLDDAQNFLISSLVISLISYLVLAGLIVIASKFVFKTSEESYHKQKRFITNASHELKTPLTIISTDLEIVEMDNGKSEWTESIRDQVNRLSKMTNELVTLSRIDEGDNNNYPFEDFSLTNLVNESIETILPSFEKEGLKLNQNIEENVAYHGNKFLIGELIYIFLDNALKYTKEKGDVDVVLRRENKNHISLTFSNDIEEGHQIDVNQLFERFYRSPSAKKSGSGIGLSMAQEVVRLHKGDIKARIDKQKIIFEISL